MVNKCINDEDMYEVNDKVNNGKEMYQRWGYVWGKWHGNILMTFKLNGTLWSPYLPVFSSYKHWW